MMKKKKNINYCKSMNQENKRIVANAYDRLHNEANRETRDILSNIYTLIFTGEGIN